MAIEDNTFPTPSPNEVFVDRYRRITPKWYPWMKKLFEALRTTINAVGVVEQTVDNVRGQYGVSVNVNGRVTASIKLDGSPADSSFAILADKFIVVHPTANEQEITAFIVGTVNGVPTVGINGNLVVDNTITAEALNVTSLSAIVANLGTVTAGVIQSADGKSRWNLNTGEFVIGEP
ncbi:MAG: hypothetical protein BVN33_14645 [Proteobacteria bacterium ST_bin13]|nr:MAG: hypothetical protein BVN33_14645 [Proteobacteria bacterium ST_bin13]